MENNQNRPDKEWTIQKPKIKTVKVERKTQIEKQTQPKHKTYLKRRDQDLREREAGKQVREPRNWDGIEAWEMEMEEEGGGW